MEHLVPVTHPALAWNGMLQKLRATCGMTSRRARVALPATTDLAGRPLLAPSVELFERGIATYNEIEIAWLKGIVDSRIEAMQDAANNAAHWAQVQEEDDERELMRSTPPE